MKPINTFIISSAIVFVALFVWPTRFRYGSSSIGGSEQVMTRTNRLTGHTDMLIGLQWMSVEEKSTPASADGKPAPASTGPVAVPQNQLDKITGTANAPMGTMYLNLYNGSDWQLTGVKVRVTGIGARSDTLWKRSYRTPISIGPLQSSTATFTFTQDPAMRRFIWFIEGAEGHWP